jgi:hypothetical protein
MDIKKDAAIEVNAAFGDVPTRTKNGTTSIGAY